MKVSEALSNVWKAAWDDAGESGGYYQRRISLLLCLPIYGGVLVPGGMRRISLEFERAELGRLHFNDEARGYLVKTEPQQQKKKLFIHLEEKPCGMPKDLFHVFCTDILEHILSCGTANEAARILHRRLQLWRRFFQSRAPEGLTRGEYVGLFGELAFFEKCLQHGGSPQVLSDAWQGPLGTNQDFLFGKLAVEVKAVTANDAGTVHISNIRQLDDAGLGGLFLWHVAYDFREGTDRKLASLVESIRTQLANSPDALVTFEDRLLAAGYIEPESSAFAKYGFAERQRSSYKVRDGFPRILESNTSPGISDISYSLSLSACLEFTISEGELMSLLPC
jgi:Putative  PD-(D/E)XK family member, (DUF4420)